MAKLSWNEIRHNAIAFSRDWQGAEREHADKQTFWNEFFEVFGLRHRLIATFEEPVRKLSGHYGFIDLFWPRTLLVEHKSRGESLAAANSQAFDYVRGLLRDGRGNEAPRCILVSDFSRLALYDLEPDDQRDLPLFDRVAASSRSPIFLWAISTATSTPSPSSPAISSTDIPRRPPSICKRSAS